MSQVLTREQLARRLSLEPSTIRRWVKQGKIPMLDLSATVRRFVWADVVKALRQLDAARRADTGQDKPPTSTGRE